MTPSPASQALEPRQSKPSQTVAVNISEGSQNRSRRFQLEVSECVETKTVTTTTRLTRKFPHVFVRDPIPLESLDTKEYPLAMKPTPLELINFSYNLPGAHDVAEDEEPVSPSSPSSPSAGKQVSDRNTLISYILLNTAPRRDQFLTYTGQATCQREM